MKLQRNLILCGALLAGWASARVVPEDWLFVPAQERAGAAHGDDAGEGVTVRYACPMFCTLLEELPEDERCPVCGMVLGKVDAEASLDRHEQWITGIDAVALEQRELSVELRLVGEVAYDEERLSVISSRTDGWIESLERKVTWERVEAGEVLYELYGPELFGAQQELLAAARAASGAAGESPVLTAARERVALLGVDAREIEAILAAGEPLAKVPFRSPSTGIVLRRAVVEGAHVKSGERLFELVDLERVWLQFEVFDSESRWLSLGSTVQVTEEWGGAERVGEVVFIDPVIDRMARTQRVRVEIDNVRRPDGTFELAPGRRVSASLRVPVEPAPVLALPRDAVLSSGEREVVYVIYEDAADGRRYELDPGALPERIGYELVQVEVGALARRDRIEAPDWYYPLQRVIPASDGLGLGSLRPGHLVLTEGALLLDSQAQLAGRPSLYYPLGRQGSAKTPSTDAHGH